MTITARSLTRVALAVLAAVLATAAMPSFGKAAGCTEDGCYADNPGAGASSLTTAFDRAAFYAPADELVDVERPAERRPLQARRGR